MTDDNSPGEGLPRPTPRDQGEGDPGTDMATVHPFPARPGTDDTDTVDAELLTDAEYEALTSHKAQAFARWQGYRTDVVTVARTARTVATHHHTRAAGRAVARHVLYAWAGGKLVASRARDATSNARYERLMRAAEATGDKESLLEWETRAEAARDRRHHRQMDWLDAPGKLVKALAVGLATVVGLLLALGVVLAVADSDVSEVIGPISAVLSLIRWSVWAFTLVWGPLVLAAPWLTLLVLWQIGRTKGDTPAWVATPAQVSESYAIITEDMLSAALANCRVATLNQALKRGAGLEYIVTPREQGGGTYVQIRLPLGSIAADFLKPEQIERLAGNLGRHKHEVYPQRQPKADARVLDLWVADQGTMDKPAPPWPLLDTGEFDVFRDRLPLGVTMRGEPVEQGMLNRHSLTGASSKQGKTAFERLKFLGLALDPTVELHIADLKGDGDWSMFQPRARTLIEGSSIEQTTATCEMLEFGVAEMQRRYDTKRAQGIRGNITRELSRKPGSGFHPIYLMVDECQVLYAEQFPIGGTKAEARAWKAAKRLHDQARAVNIHLYQATQRPDDRTLPVPVREGAHVRSALYVPNYETAKMVLADAADMGARPQALRMGRDAGTVVLTGEVDAIPEGMAFVITKSHYVETKAAYGVIERAMTILAQHGRSVETAGPAELEPVRDFLSDLDTVMGGRLKERTEFVRPRLAKLHASYADWSAIDLAGRLREAGVPIRKSEGNSVIRAQDIAAARVLAAADDTDDGDQLDSDSDWNNPTDIDGE